MSMKTSEMVSDSKLDKLRVKSVIFLVIGGNVSEVSYLPHRGIVRTDQGVFFYKLFFPKELRK